VVNAYEKARQWAQENPQETAQILADAAGIELAIAEKVLIERTNLDVGEPGQKQRDVLEIVGPIFVESKDVASQRQIDDALSALFNDSFYQKADSSAIGD
jgi:sulfonate transport system substrate-binding protein